MAREKNAMKNLNQSQLDGRLHSEIKEKEDTQLKDMEEHPSSSSSEKVKSKLPFYKLFSFADSLDIILMIFGSVGAVGNGLSVPLMTVLLGNMINSFGENPDFHRLDQQVAKVCLDFVYLALGTGMAAFLELTCWMVTGERQAARIRNLYLKAILRQEISFFDKETETGEVIEGISGDNIMLREAISEKVGKFIQLMSTFLGAFAIAFIRAWDLTIVMIASIPPLGVAAAVMAILVTKISSRQQEIYAKATVITEQTIGSIRTVASFTGERKAADKYKKSLKSACSATVLEGVAVGIGTGVMLFFMFSGYSLGLWYGGKLILSKGYTGGKVFNAILAVLLASFTLGQASSCLNSFALGRVAGFKIFETIKRQPEIDAYDSTGKVLDDIQGNIELRNIVFSYPTRPAQKVFVEFSLSIPSGISVALVGESGSGKSTVISLIERFYDPQSGEVLIDGINLKEFQLRWIRGKIGLVSQEPVLFASSIRDNIAYGKEGSTDEEIKEAATLANASKFIDQMPQGLDTMVGEHGTQLSGGQKQRVAIARAILKNPRILLLDEATSALDVESERVVQEALDRVMTNRTTVIVAHRLSTVKNTDMIAVIHRGCIVEKGRHSELILDPDGTYSQLIRLQETVSSAVSDSIASLAVKQPSFRISLHRSISHGSSIGNSSRHSFSIGNLGLPAAMGFDISDVTSHESEVHGHCQKSPDVSLWRLASLNKPEILVFIAGVIPGVIQGCLLPMFGLLLSNAIGTFYKPPHKLREDSRFWASMFLILGLTPLVTLPLRSYFFGVAGAKLIKRVRFMCFEKIIHMEIGWFDLPENSSGAIGARLSTDAAKVRSLVGDSLALVVDNISCLVAGLLISFTASWQLSFIVLALLPLLGINGYIQLKIAKGFSKNAKMMYEDASQVANDAVGNIRTVASFSAEQKVVNLYKKKCEGPVNTGIRQGLLSGIGYGVSFFLYFCVYATCFYAGVKIMEDGKATFTEVFRVFFVLSLAAVSVTNSSTLAPDATKAKSATASIFAIIDRKSKITSDDESMVLEQVKGNVEFRHISFRYPTRPNVPVFQDLCFTASSGKVIALVGESGCGKSTVLSLLQRFYDPTSGLILLDGVDIKTLNLRWLRQMMGMVSQEPVLFNETIRDNIAYGKEEASESDIIAAAETANAHKFISGLYQGYDTVVGERGVQLSGGQKQRVAIARAIIKEPKILLLDEATSALDAESERVVQEALDKVMVNRTTIVIAHRLSTIKGADTIAVVKDGAIVQKGTHDSLIKIKDGPYASLVQLYGSASTSNSSSL